jgi:hypothetical protein
MKSYGLNMIFQKKKNHLKHTTSGNAKCVQ